MPRALLPALALALFGNGWVSADAAPLADTEYCRAWDRIATKVAESRNGGMRIDTMEAAIRAMDENAATTMFRTAVAEIRRRAMASAGPIDVEAFSAEMQRRHCL